jgi:hypothetical protein
LPFTAVLGANLAVVPRVVLAQAEVVAADRPNASGYDLAYRGGLQLGFGRRLPVSAFGSVDFDSDFSAVLWMVGLSIGGNDTATLGFSGRAVENNTRLDRVSVTGVATRYFSP